MQGTARKWYLLMDQASRLLEMNWDEIKSELIKAFCPEDFQADLIRKLMTRVQTEGESIQDYWMVKNGVI